MQRLGPPSCRLVLFGKSSRKHFSAADLETQLRGAAFSVHLRGHVGPRKAIFDSIRCGSLPIIASDLTPLPLSDEIDYAAFALRVPERTDPAKVLEALQRLDETKRRAMRVAMAAAAVKLDSGPLGSLAYEVLRRFVRVARGGHGGGKAIKAVPLSTRTPLPMLPL